jgi:hypothetical protein
VLADGIDTGLVKLPKAAKNISKQKDTFSDIFLFIIAVLSETKSSRAQTNFFACQ